MTEWLAIYLHNKTVYRGEDWKAALSQAEPFTKADQLYVSSISLLEFLRRSLNEIVSKKGLWAMFRACDFESTAVNARLDGRNLHRKYWRASTAKTRELLGADNEP